MHPTKSGPSGNNTRSHKPGLAEKFWRRLGFSNQPSLRLYAGYGHAQHLVIYGHTLSFAPLPRKKYSRFFLINLLALVRMFIVRSIKGAVVRLQWDGIEFNTRTETDGFFRLNWQSTRDLSYGWQEVKVEVMDENGKPVTSACAPVMVPHSTQYAFISDIDDTFLISHSSNLRKRLALLFTRNARTRKPFEGVVKHYQLLAQAHASADEPNPFFYVSSSEWNLYDYINEFMVVNGLPRGVLLLNTIKHLTDFLSSGQTGHGTKFARIVRVLEAFPKQRFVLMGDSSQQDPVIYQSIISHFPDRIHAIYIRDIHRRNSERVREVLQQLEASGVHCCFFKHSSEAIEHSRRIGLIT